MQIPGNKLPGMHIFIYGPPGSGKSTLAGALSEALDLVFCDLDHRIEANTGKLISEIFADGGEVAFRQRELQALREVVAGQQMVVALGGGALLNPQARAMAEANGTVLCLEADEPVLLERMRAEEGIRPLLAGDPAARLHKLLSKRGEHYHSFPLRLDTTRLPRKELTWQAQLKLGRFHVSGMGPAYDAVIESGGLDRLGAHFQARGLMGPVALVSDRNVGGLYLERAAQSLRAAGYAVETYCIEPGEAHKTVNTVQDVWDFFLRIGIERGSTVAALGGGVVGDLTGFAAATFLRGVPWVNLPTTLLSMVDSSLGGKTGVDLPQAKNMVGAFYPPRLVLADPQTLRSLPERELRNGMAETVKHAIINDPDLFSTCEAGPQAVAEQLDLVVRQSMAVKLKVIEVDPYEKGLRQALNLGHTIGHGVELASQFAISHGEAVAIGTVAEARLAGQMGLAEAGLAERIADVLERLGLPVTVPRDMPLDQITQAMQHDKKRAAGKLRFALPVAVGEVRTGVVIEHWPELFEKQLKREA
jgi:shikimate kinase / 3-dehydroquinate synthase